MYHQHFGLTEVPFSIKVNPGYLFMTAQHKDALATLLYGASAEGGFALLTGEVGTGKTTLIRALLQQLPDNTDIALVLNPAMNPIELLATICDELKIEYNAEQQSLKHLTDKLHQYLLDSYSQGRSAVVLIDEAQHLQTDALEQIRLLTNLETDTRKLLQIILVGQPELDEKLRETELRQLAQRITARFCLGPLNEDETAAYIGHRLQVAGLSGQQSLFPSKTIKRIHQVSEGYPRLINILCDRILLGCYAKKRSTVDDDIVELAIDEVFGSDKEKLPGKPADKTGWGANVLAGMLLLGVAIFLIVRGNLGTEEVNAVASESTQTENTIALDPQLTAAQQSEQFDELLVHTEKPQAEWWSAAFADQNQAMKAIETYFQNAGVTHTISCDNNTELTQIACISARYDAWQDVLSLNRVSIVKLLTPGRFNAYVPVIGVEQDQASILDQDGQSTIGLNAIGRLWTGDAVSFWLAPAAYEQPIAVGSRGLAVQWVAKQFSELDQQAPLAQLAFNSALSARVKLFQRDYALDDDGIVGANTILKLNEAVQGVPDVLLLQRGAQN
ncbi:MAG: AAA family ATPase [Pseudomonadales bacterium]